MLGIVLHSFTARVPPDLAVCKHSGHLRSDRLEVKMLFLPEGLWAAGDEARRRAVRSDQDPFPEGQEAVTHRATHQPPRIHTAD